MNDDGAVILDHFYVRDIFFFNFVEQFRIHSGVQKTGEELRPDAHKTTQRVVMYGYLYFTEISTWLSGFASAPVLALN